MDTRVGDKIGLELVQVDVESTIETERGGDGANNLGNQAVEVLEVRARNVEVATADVVDGLVVNKESTIRVLDGGVSRQNGVVRLNDGSRDTGSRVDGELELTLLAVFGRKAFEKECAESRAGASAKRMEDQETLEGVTVV